MYFRYLLYDFIQSNSYMLYTKDFAVKIGNLLPSEYETESGGIIYINKIFYMKNFLKTIY